MKMPHTKYCFMKTCKNNTGTSPGKQFFTVPDGNKAEWCAAAELAHVPTRGLFICEDHLDLEEDMENFWYWRTMKARLKPRLPVFKSPLQLEEDTNNYVEYQIMTKHLKQKTTLRLKKGILPHKFECQKPIEAQPPLRGQGFQKGNLEIMEDDQSLAKKSAQTTIPLQKYLGPSTSKSSSHTLIHSEDIGKKSIREAGGSSSLSYEVPVHTIVIENIRPIDTPETSQEPRNVTTLRLDIKIEQDCYKKCGKLFIKNTANLIFSKTYYEKPKEDLKNYHTFKKRRHRPIFKLTAKLRNLKGTPLDQVPSTSQSSSSELVKVLQKPPILSIKEKKHEDISTPSSSMSGVTIPNEVPTDSQPGCPKLLQHLTAMMDKKRKCEDISMPTSGSRILSKPPNRQRRPAPPTGLRGTDNSGSNTAPSEQCRFCGKFSKNYTDVADKPYFSENKTVLALNSLTVDLDFNNERLPRTVCLDCDEKLQDMFDFVKLVKFAQDTMINIAEDARPIETVIVKAECESPTPDDNDTEDEIHDDKDDINSMTVCVTVDENQTDTLKRKIDEINTTKKKPKLPKVKESEAPELMIEIKKESVEKDELVNSEFNIVIKEETIENDDEGSVNADLVIDIKEEPIHRDNATNDEISETVEIKPSEVELATRALLNEMGDENS